MKTIKVSLLVSLLALLAGCVAVPVAPGPPGYYAPEYVGPSIGIGIYGDSAWAGHRHGGYGRGHWHH